MYWLQRPVNWGEGPAGTAVAGEFCVAFLASVELELAHQQLDVAAVVAGVRCEV